MSPRTNRRAGPTNAERRCFMFRGSLLLLQSVRQKVAGSLISVLFLVGCNSDPSAGAAFSGNPPSKRCSTGTVIVLVNPVPGSTVTPGERAVEIASNGAIASSAAALAVTSGAARSPARLLYGPILPPTPTPGTASLSAPSIAKASQSTPTPAPTPSPQPTAPIPFPSPVFYQARGFRLAAHRSYSVDVASETAKCTLNPIGGATFETGKASASRRRVLP